jgi:hypothetical protein
MYPHAVTLFLTKVPNGREPLPRALTLGRKTGIESSRIVAIHGDHLRPRLASSDDHEGILLNSLDDSRSDRAGRLSRSQRGCRVTFQLCTDRDISTWLQHMVLFAHRVLWKKSASDPAWLNCEPAAVDPE